MLIQVLVDNPKSYIIPYAKELVSYFRERGHESSFLQKSENVREGDILLLLSCRKIFKALDRNQHNLVIHASNLPEGRGWSPLTWQILEGKAEITVTLFEATEEVDAGVIYLQEQILFKGDELLPELQEKLSMSIIRLAKKFVDDFSQMEGREQEGVPSFYPRRKPEDSELDVNKPIAEQFNLLRVCDNEQYPAFFYLHGCKYKLKIEKA